MRINEVHDDCESSNLLRYTISFIMDKYRDSCVKSEPFMSLPPIWSNGGGMLYEPSDSMGKDMVSAIS